MSRAETSEIEIKAHKFVGDILAQDERWALAYRSNIGFRYAIDTLSQSFMRIVDDQLAITAPGIEDLDLTVRAYNVLKREGIHTTAQLCERTPWDLLEMRNMGRGALKDIQNRLAAIGLRLKDDI